MPMTLRQFTLGVLLLAASLHSHGFDLQGHRGARALTPENTLPIHEFLVSIPTGWLNSLHTSSKPRVSLYCCSAGW